MNKTLSLLVFAAFMIFSCTKKEVLPAYIAPQIFSVNSRMAHAADTVNVGDTIILTAKGLIADTTNAFSSNFKIFSGSVNTAGAFSSSGTQVGGVVLKPVTKVIASPSGTSPLYNWTATYNILVPSVHKSNVLVTGYFENSLTLSSQTGNQVSNDAKAIYVR